MLKNKNITLRGIEEPDLKKFKEWRNSEIVRPYMREFKPLNMLNQKKWFESSASSNHIMFAIENNEELIGCCGLTYIDWKNGHAEISIYTGDKKWQRKGYASETVQLLLKYGFEELRLHKIFATIFRYNTESIKLFEKNKFVFDGIHREARYWNGKYHDELVYSILDREYPEK